MARDYYVIKEGGQWKVKLEAGRVINVHRTQKAAKREAKRLARNNNRGVTVNAAAGYTRYSINKDDV
jgi:TusA-related sulfurtransferase